MDRRKVLLVVAVVVAALGAALVFVYAQGAEDRAQSDIQTVPVIVATQPIAAGESADDAAEAGKLLSKQVPADQVIPGATNDGTVFKGLVALTPIYPGEQLLPAKFGASVDVAPVTSLVTPPKGKGSMQIVVDDPNHVGSFLQAGSRVGIFQVPCARPFVYDDDTKNAYDAARARVVLPDALVLAVGSTTVGTQPQVDSQGNPVPVSSTSITVAVDEEEALLLGGLGYNPAAPLFFVLKNQDTKIKAAPDLDPQAGGCAAPAGG